MFKKSFCKLFMVFLLTTVNVNAVHADPPVEIHIFGNVVASPCSLDIAGSDLSPSLGDIQATALADAGSSSAWIPFDLKLKDCPVSTTSATVTFNGVPDQESNDRYSNQGNATNVAVELQSADGDNLGNGKTLTGTIEQDHTYTYKLQTRAYSNAGEVMPGTISAVVQATFTYQ